MLAALLIAWTTWLARMSGGGFPAPWLKEKLKWDGLPEMLFGLTFGIAAYIVYGSPWAAAMAWGCSWACMETGHRDVLAWGDNPNITREYPPLSRIVDPIAAKLGFKYADLNYCRLFMAVKGFCIGLPVGGVLLAVLWPLAYEIGHRVKRPDGLDEMLSGFFAGISILIFLFTFG